MCPLNHIVFVEPACSAQCVSTGNKVFVHTGRRRHTGGGVRVPRHRKHTCQPPLCFCQVYEVRCHSGGRTTTKRIAADQGLRCCWALTHIAEAGGNCYLRIDIVSSSLHCCHNGTRFPSNLGMVSLVTGESSIIPPLGKAPLANCGSIFI